MTKADKNERPAPTMWGIQHAVGLLIGVTYEGIRRAGATVARWRGQRALELELLKLRDQDLSDIDVGRSQIATIARARHAPQLLRRMLATLGVTDEALARHPDMRERLLQACIRCETRAECSRWLKSGQPDESYRAFCPNESSLTMLRKSC